MLSMGCGTSKNTVNDIDGEEKSGNENGTVSQDVTVVANSPITSLPTPNIEVHNDADEKLEIQGTVFLCRGCTKTRMNSIQSNDAPKVDSP